MLKISTIITEKNIPFIKANEGKYHNKTCPII